MRSPSEMGIIEIDITNACVHQCANCTRFCGHHKKPFFMDFETFKQAVDSLEEFPGMIGIIGGEPTLHPEFEKFADYIREKRTKTKTNISWGPISDMQFHIHSTVDKGTSKAVLLSSLSTSYYKNFEVINDTFSFQLLNDHSSESLHQALLMSAKELPISKDEWIKKRDACWIQNTWSATITPKGAFFCEVAGSFDMLFDGPGGWKVEKNWWKRSPEDFSEQLHWCELCSGCLDVPKRLAHDERDDVTPFMYEKLKGIGSQKVKENRVVIRKPDDYETYKDPSFTSGSEYIEAGENIRMSTKNKSLYPKDIYYFDIKELKDRFSRENCKDWIIIFEREFSNDLKEKYISFFNSMIWNPGCIYIFEEGFIAFNVKARSIRDCIDSVVNNKKPIVDYYKEEKVIYLSTTDPLIHVIGGDSELMKKRGDRKGKKVLVYGAGNVGKAVIDILDRHHIENYDVVVTKICDEDKKEVKGHILHEIDEYTEKTDEVIVIIAVASWLYSDILYELNKRNIYNYRFIV